MDRRKVWGARALQPSRSWAPGRDGRREKMVNKYGAIVYIRLNASMINPKKKKDMKLAIVALGLRKDSLIMVNCAANLVIQVPTLLFQTDLVPDGRAGELGFTERRRRMVRDNAPV